jgi:hypothetical protein
MNTTKKKPVKVYTSERLAEVEAEMLAHKNEYHRLHSIWVQEKKLLRRAKSERSEPT